jgi:hypothetical protein
LWVAKPFKVPVNEELPVLLTIFLTTGVVGFFFGASESSSSESFFFFLGLDLPCLNSSSSTVLLCDLDSFCFLAISTLSSLSSGTKIKSCSKPSCSVPSNRGNCGCRLTHEFQSKTRNYWKF